MTIETWRVENNINMPFAGVASYLASFFTVVMSMPLEKWGVVAGIAVAIFTAWVNHREKRHAMACRERELALHERDLAQRVESK